MLRGLSWVLVVLCLLACGDDDGGASGSGGDAGSAGSSGTGGAGGDSGVTATCTRTSDCDDGLYCNGEETCDPTHDDADAMGCVAGARDCSDGIACTLDACDEDNATCTHAAPDADDDGHGDLSCIDDTGATLGDDCDDNDEDRFPGNAEDCDDHDEDCDLSTFGTLDGDGDGIIANTCCNPTDTEPACGRDCDDSNVAINDQQVEFCDNIDNDCDDAIDEDTADVAWFTDADGDGFGSDRARPQPSCTPIAGASLLNRDCDDGDPARHPAQLDICDNSDNNCNGARDEHGGEDCETRTPSTTPLVNECANGLDDCGVGTYCVDLALGFRCDESDPCDTNNGGCDAQPMAACSWSMTQGVVQCACPAGTSGNGIGVNGCVEGESDECAIDNGGCGDPDHVVCVDSRSFAPPRCIDIDECAAETDTCTNNQACIDTPGGFTCITDTPCSQTDYTLTTQAQVQALAAEGCSHIEGNLSFVGELITSVAGLTSLRAIGGDLWLGDTLLTTLNGLHNVTRIGGSFTLDTNNGLTDIGMSGLRVVGGLVLIVENWALPDLDGLQALQEIEGGLGVYRNPALRNVNALQSLRHVGGTGVMCESNGLTSLSLPALIETEHFDVRTNDLLAGISGLSALRRVNGNLSIHGNGALRSITGFANMESVGGHLEIGSNPMLLQLSGFNVVDVGGWVYLYDNAALVSVTGFSALRNVGLDLDVRNHAQLTDIAGFQAVEHVGGHLEIDGNQVLRTISGLDALRSVGTHMWIDNNAALETIDGFSTLSTIGQYLSVAYNPALTHITGLTGLTEINEDLRIEGNLVLRDIRGLRSGALQTLGDQLRIALNPALSVCEVNALTTQLTNWAQQNLSAGNEGCTACTQHMCTGTAGGVAGQSTVFGSVQSPATFDHTQGASLPLLANITEITGNLVIWSTLITNVAPLARLTRVRGELVIFDNDNLTNLNGLSALTRVDVRLGVQSNGLLGSLGGGNVGLVNLTHAGALLVAENPALTSLDGLRSLQTVGTNIEIRDNYALTECAVDALVDNLNGWSGSYTQTGNLMCEGVCNAAQCE